MRRQRGYRVTLIPGDGIGPEVIEAATAVVAAAGVDITWDRQMAGAAAVETGGNPIPDELIRSIRRNRVALKGPLATRVGTKGFRSVNVALRKTFDLYANLRPIRNLPGIESAFQGVNLVVVRENTEDLYSGIEFEQGTEDNRRFMDLLKTHFPKHFARVRFTTDCGIGIKNISREGTERLVRAAIEYALTQRRRSLTIVHKGNILKYTEGAFRAWAYALAERDFADRVYTWPQWERTKAASGEAAANEEQSVALKNGKLLVKDAIADITLQQVLTRADEFDVIATMNLNGDYLSDALAAQVGGIGIAPGANINYVSGHAVFEATHGTAPKYADLDQVNPGSVILSGEMMLRYLGWTEAADAIIGAMDRTIGQKTVTYDFARLMDGATKIKTSEFADALIRNF